MNDNEGKEIKTILVGMSGTGKTNIIKDVTRKLFNTNYFIYQHHYLLRN